MSESEYDGEAGRRAARRALEPIRKCIVRVLGGVYMAIVVFRMALVFGRWKIEWFCFRVKWLPFTLNLFTLSDPEADYFYEERRRLIEDKGGVVMAKLDRLAAD